MVHCILCKETIIKIRDRDDEYTAQCVEVKNSLTYHKHEWHKLSTNLELPNEYIVCLKCLDRFEVERFYIHCDICNKSYKSGPPDELFDRNSDEQARFKTNTTPIDNYGKILSDNSQPPTEISTKELTKNRTCNESMDDVEDSDESEWGIKLTDEQMEHMEQLNDDSYWINAKTYRQLEREKLQANDPEYKYVFSDDEDDVVDKDWRNNGKEDNELLRRRRPGTGKCDATILNSCICTGYDSSYDSYGNIRYVGKRPDHLVSGALICDECITDLINRGICRDPSRRYNGVKCQCKLCRMT